MLYKKAKVYDVRSLRNYKQPLTMMVCGAFPFARDLAVSMSNTNPMCAFDILDSEDNETVAVALNGKLFTREDLK